MGSFLFARPWALLVFVPAVAAIVWRALAARRRPAMKVGAVGPLRFVPRTAFARAPWLPQLFGAAGLLLIVLGLARPQVRTSNPRDVSVEGIDIVVALDLSTSMLAADFRPKNRIFVAKEVLKEFVQARPSDRIGLVVFAAEAFTQCPLTLDHAVLLNIIDRIRMKVIPDGTAIGDGLATALNRLRESTAKSKVAVVITDGDNNAGSISPLQAAQMAKDLGVRVYTILVGKGGKVPYPVTDLFGRQTYQDVELDTNPDLLKQMANKADGAFYQATDKESLTKSLQDILDSLEKTRLFDAGVSSHEDELEMYLLFPGVLLVLLDVLLRATRFPEVPMTVLGAAWQFSVLGAPARIAWPMVLWAFAGVGLAGALWLRAVLLRRRALAKVAPDRLLALMAPAAGAGRDVAAGVAMLLGLMLLTIAAAEPQCGAKTIKAKRYGMDVVIAIDASTSMLARDVKPSRIDRAKLELTDLIDRLHGDRVGIVVFAGDAFVQCPLTSDYAAAKLFLKAIDPKDLPQQGTALAEALKTSETLFTGADEGPSTAASRAIVLLTDGEDHEGAVDDEARALSGSGVKVYTVGVGSVSGEPIPLVDADGKVVGYKKDHSGQTIMTRLNEEVLQSIAQATGGQYVHSASGDLGVGQIADELNHLDKAEYETQMVVEYDERYEYFAWPGAMLLLAAWVLGEGRFRRRRESLA